MTAGGNVLRGESFKIGYGIEGTFTRRFCRHRT